ncbi:MAG: hypothetical protein ABIK82_05415 [Pseudomonadota bacterium]
MQGPGAGIRRCHVARDAEILGWRAATGVPQIVSRMLKGEFV